jgi:hypothetical protein
MAQAMFTPYSADIIQSSREQGLLKRPEMKRMTELDQAIADALSRTDLTPTQRQQLFEDNLQKFRNVRKEIILNGTTLQPDESELENILRKLMEALKVNNEQQPIITAAAEPIPKKRKLTISKTDPIISTPVRPKPALEPTPVQYKMDAISKLKTEYMEKILNSSAQFIRDPDTNVIYHRNKIIPTELMDNAVNLLFSPTKVEQVPQDVSKLGTKIAAVLKKSMKSPEFQQLTATYPFFGQFQRTTRSRTGQGYSIDFQEWDKYLTN